jgi:uncharacterized membrane protein YwaF
MLIIFGSIVGAYFALRKGTKAEQEKVLRILAYALVISYISDFFVHEFVYGTIDAPGGLNMDKLPFHICTVLCPLVCFAQFRKNSKILEPVVILATLAPLMYLCYPASVGDGEPWCYQSVQTMFYHGMLLGWGVLNLAFGITRPHIKTSWKTAIALVCITLWAKLGNILLDHNWFFLNEDAFYIGLVENGVIPKWSLMIINPVVFFVAALAVYGISHAINKRRGFDGDNKPEQAQPSYSYFAK